MTGVTADNKVYDGSADATLNATGATLVGVVGSEDVTLTGTAMGTFDNKDAGFGKTVTVTGLNITGADAGNYALTQPATTADITKATPALSITNSPVTFNGLPQAADVEGAVPGTVSNVKYDGFAAEPTFPGAYAVTADFLPDDPDNYESLTDAPAGDFVIEGFVYYYPWISK